MKKILTLFLLTLMATTAMAQSALERDGDEAFAAGLYKQALDLYKKAARSHPSFDLTYKMGDAARMAHDYARAIDCYREVATSIYHVDYPHVFYYLGAMHKCNGAIDSAAYWIDRYLASVPGDESLSARARQEARACEWAADTLVAQQQTMLYAVKQESKNINTPYSESGAIMVADTLMLFSTMQEINAPGKKGAVDMDLVLMQVHEASVQGPKTGSSRLVKWGINDKERHTGNVAMDTYYWTIYFTRSEEKAGNSDYGNIVSHIYCSSFREGKWQKARKLEGDINLKGVTSTHPAVAHLDDGTIVLYFASNRDGGMGGMDIWYATIKEDGTVGPVANAGPIINTPGDEVTPFYCEACSQLYFSSDWHFGYGGFDVFSASGSLDQWQEPVNLGASLNSPANDIYFSVNDNNPNQGFLTSNRKGSYFISDNTCCNDIYRWSRKPKPAPQKKEQPQPRAMKGAVHSLLPISLYFHNDTPDPKSELYTTKVNYFETYNRYMFMRQHYKNAFAGMDDTEKRDSIYEEIDHFFDYEVHDNCLAFEEFINLLIEDLRSGKRVNITIEGYASPVHNGKYNQKLSQRRVNSIVNQLMEYDHGRLKPFIGSKGQGSLRINEVAYGSSRAAEGVSNSYSDSQASVYSVEASRERRIEILDYQYMEDDSTLITCLRIPSRAVQLGSFERGERTEFQVRIPHNALHETTLDYINVGNPDVQILGYTKLTPGRDLVVYLRMDNRKADPTVSSFLPLTLRVSGEQVTQTMFLEYEIKK